jgi:hypothetical protein
MIRIVIYSYILKKRICLNYSKIKIHRRVRTIHSDVVVVVLRMVVVVVVDDGATWKANIGDILPLLLWIATIANTIENNDLIVNILVIFVSQTSVDILYTIWFGYLFDNKLKLVMFFVSTDASRVVRHRVCYTYESCTGSYRYRYTRIWIAFPPMKTSPQNPVFSPLWRNLH